MAHNRNQLHIFKDLTYSF